MAAALVKHEGIPTFAIKGEDNKTYYRHIESAIAHKPHLSMDDGADVVSSFAFEAKDLLRNVIGGTEETTTGVIRLRSMAEKKVLKFPVISVNDADTKHMFDNRYGTGQSTMDGIMRATNRLVCGSTLVVAGYGWCGRGIATRATRHGRQCHRDRNRSLQGDSKRSWTGSASCRWSEAAPIGDFFVTVTGNFKVIRGEHFATDERRGDRLQFRSFQCRVGYSRVGETEPARNCRHRPGVEQFTLKTGRRVSLLGEGRLVNLATAEGHPSSVMDMSFANQAWVRSTW